MKIDFFSKDGYTDKRILDGGIYTVDLVEENSNKVIHLYVGEAACIANRCGKHLMGFSKNSEYFGIKKQYLKNDNLILRFNVYCHMKKKVGRYDKDYIEKENEVIHKLKPKTQNADTQNDNMISNPKKTKIVDDEMKKMGFI